MTDINDVPYQHSQCWICAKFVFDKLVPVCPKCGGAVHYYTARDLFFLERKGGNSHDLGPVRL